MLGVNTDKNVYILGAGFSKEIGLPLQDDFLLLAKEVYFRDTRKYKHFEKVFEYQDSLSKMRKYLNYPLLNLEHLFNIMEMDVFYSKSEKVADIKNDFVSLICDVLMEQTPSPLFRKKSKLTARSEYDNYLTFLELFIKDDTSVVSVYEDTIITFNYDLAIEATATLYNWKRDNLNDETHRRAINGRIEINTLFGKDNIVQGEISDFFFGERKTSSLRACSDFF
jgi:uncharacterized protein YydD (DUF2326 family)